MSKLSEQVQEWTNEVGNKTHVGPVPYELFKEAFSHIGALVDEVVRLEEECLPCLDKQKTLGNTTFSQVQDNVPDVQVFGDGNLFKCIAKAWSKKEGWLKSTKAMEIPLLGVVVQVTTQQGMQVAEALTFVPGATIVGDGDKRRIVADIKHSNCRAEYELGTEPDGVVG